MLQPSGRRRNTQFLPTRIPLRLGHAVTFLCPSLRKRLCLSTSRIASTGSSSDHSVQGPRLITARIASSPPPRLAEFGLVQPVLAELAAVAQVAHSRGRRCGRPARSGARRTWVYVGQSFDRTFRAWRITPTIVLGLLANRKGALSQIPQKPNIIL